MKSKGKNIAAKQTSRAKQTTKSQKPSPELSLKDKRSLYDRLFGNEKLNRRFIRISLFVFLVTGFILRVMNVGGLSLWSDEFVHVMRARDVIRGTGPLFTGDNNGILLTIIMIPFFAVLGISEWVARFPSVLFSTTSIYLIYLIGTRLFGRFVGWTSAFLSTFSLYLIYWARIARNYAIFEFFYLLLIYLLLLTLQEPESGKSFWKKWKVNPKYLLILVGAFILSIMTHQLIFVFFIGLGFYFIGIAVSKIITRNPDRFSNVYFFGALISLIGLLFLWIPFLQPVTAVIFRSLVYENLQQFVLPDWERISALWNSDQRLESFGVYWDVMKHDMNLLFPYSIAGMLLALFIRWQSGWLLFSFTMIPFLLMSFVYRDPCDPRYMIFFYPLAMMGVACFFEFFSFFLFGRVISRKWTAWIAVPVCLYFVISLFLEIRFRDLYELDTVKRKTGYIVDKALSKWTFVDWKDDLQFVKKNIQPGDVIMATNPTPVAYYLDSDSVIWYRQRKLNAVTRKYEDLPTMDVSGHSANSLKEINATFEKKTRGWLIADYYLLTVFTLDSARDFAWNNFNFHFEASRYGTVQVFSWDHQKPSEYQPDFVFEMGKNDLMMRSEKLGVELSEPPPGEIPYVLVLTEGLDSDREGYMIVNDKARVFLPKNTSKGPEYMKVTLPAEYVHEGMNTFKFYYSKGSADPNPGYVAYRIFDGYTSIEPDE